MAMSDPLGDLLTRIRNGQQANKRTIKAPGSRLHCNVLDVLQREGYIRSYEMREVRRGVREVDIELKYADGGPAIHEIARVSRPGQRVYSKIKELPRVYNGLGITILSTPQGVLSDAEARQANVGGEVLCRVF